MRRTCLIMLCLSGLITTEANAKKPSGDDRIIDGVAMIGFRGQVLDVHDGDTVTVVQPAPKGGCPGIHHIRIQGIDAPELSQNYGKAAKQHAARLLYGHKVWVWVSDRPEKWGRHIGRVCWSRTSPYRCVGYQLVRQGLAWHYKQYSGDKRLARAEKRARKAKKGLWKQPNPVAPWDYRKKRRSKASPSK